MEPTELSKFTLLQKMGKGGVGTVYRARDNDTGRIVALKTFTPDQDRPPQRIRRLRDREVKMLASIRHPNVIRYFESGQYRDCFYYTMEFVEDSLLKLQRSNKPLSLLDKVHILRQSADALVEIHQKGVIHRDVKPGNILLDRDPNGAFHVKLTDLGIAKDVSESDIVREGANHQVPGTAKYLSPEQITHVALDGRSDVFSLGIVAYQLLTGAKPFNAEAPGGYLTANLEQEATPLDHISEDLPAWLCRMLEKMMAKDRQERYDSETLARDLALAEQHLIRGTPLVEEANSLSIFYRPSGQQEPVRKRRFGRIAASTWITALAVLIAGGMAADLLWPGASAGPHADLKRARRLANGGAPWYALALLRDLPTDKMDAPDAAAVRRLSLSSQDTLGSASYRCAIYMLEQDRRPEAEVLLRQMEDMFPQSSWTDRLRHELEAR